MSRSLYDLVRPEALAYFFHTLHKEQKLSGAALEAFRGHLEKSMVQTTTHDPSYFKDVATVWAALMPKSKIPAGTTITRANETSAHLIINDSSDLADLGNEINSGRCTIQLLSVLKYALSQKWARSLLASEVAEPDACVTPEHVKNLTKLMVRYAVDCTFKSTGDWMINSKTQLLCPAWLTCVTAGGDAPYAVATDLHGASLNDKLKATIRTPIQTQVRNALDGSEGPDAFLALCAVFGELVPKTKFALNNDVLSAPDVNVPAPFYVRNCILPGVFTKDAHGIALNGRLMIFNGRGIAPALCRCLYMMTVVGRPQAHDAAEYVFSHDAISDSNPYAKYV